MSVIDLFYAPVEFTPNLLAFVADLFICLEGQQGVNGAEGQQGVSGAEGQQRVNGADHDARQEGSKVPEGLMSSRSTHAGKMDGTC